MWPRGVVVSVIPIVRAKAEMQIGVGEGGRGVEPDILAHFANFKLKVTNQTEVCHSPRYHFVFLAKVSSEMSPERR